MNIARFAIEKSRITIMLLLTVVLMGSAMYFSLSRDSMPPYTVRIANIVTDFPGANPERVELLLSSKIEEVVQEIPELKEVSSTSRTGLSVVTVVLKDEVSPDDLQSVWDTIRRKISTINGLPQGVKPELKDEGVADIYGIVVGLIIDGYSYAEVKPYVEDIRDDLIKIPEAAKVTIGGLQDKRLFIEFDNAHLKEYGLSASLLRNFISSTNILSSGGTVNIGDEQVILEPTGNFDTVKDIQNLLIPIRGGQQLVRLGDITQIREAYIEPPIQIVRINGLEAVSLHVSLKKNANITELGEQVNLLMQQWQRILPVGLELVRVSSLDGYIQSKISDFIINLLQSIVIVLAVMLFFLGLRTGMIVASLIPVVIVMTLFIMGGLKVGLNQVTLAALIMALGMLVDNAIVVAETIIVKLEQGFPIKKAVIVSASELFLPLLISTLTTSAAFLAFYLSPTIMGDIVGPIFIVITIALLSSWVVALMVVTLFCYFFLRNTKQKEKSSMVDAIIASSKQYYQTFLLGALARKYLTLTIIFSLFIVSIYSFQHIQFLFFPDSDRNMVTIDINLPTDTKVQATTRVVEQLEEYIVAHLKTNQTRKKGIESWSSYIGQGPESYDLGYTQEEANSSYAHILINTSSFRENNRIIQELDKYNFSHFPNAEIKVSALSADGSGVPIEIKVSGPDPDILARISESIKTQLSSIAGTKNIKDDWGPKSKKLLIKVDQNRAQMAGLSSQDIAISLSTVLDGFQTGEFRQESNSIPIIMRSDAGHKQTIASLQSLNIYVQSTGKSIPLLQVADIIPQWQYAKIRRLDLNRTITISCQLHPYGNAASIMDTILPWLKEQKKTEWPKGYSFSLGGDAKKSAENMGSVVQYLPLSAFIMILLLIIQFNSFRKTSIVICTIPLGLIGVVFGLLLFQEPFGFMPFLGVVSLAGIIINNAIVLLDRVETERNELRKPEKVALINACLQRFRPILLATCTTILGLIPLYLSGGELWEGMAISIMTGLLFGTAITLVFVPIMYSILYNINFTKNE